MRCYCNQILKILWVIKVPFGDICFGRLDALVHFCPPDVEDITVNIFPLEAQDFRHTQTKPESKHNWELVFGVLTRLHDGAYIII